MIGGAKFNRSVFGSRDNTNVYHYLLLLEVVLLFRWIGF